MREWRFVFDICDDATTTACTRSSRRVLDGYLWLNVPLNAFECSVFVCACRYAIAIMTAHRAINNTTMFFLPIVCGWVWMRMSVCMLRTRYVSLIRDIMSAERQEAAFSSYIIIIISFNILSSFDGHTTSSLSLSLILLHSFRWRVAAHSYSFSACILQSRIAGLFCKNLKKKSQQKIRQTHEREPFLCGS